MAGRPRRETPAAPQLPAETEERIAQAAVAADARAIADQVVMQALPVMEAIGQIKASHFYATVADRVIAETYKKVKESKGYVGLPYVDADGNPRRVAVLEEFAEVFLGKSARRCQELAKNLELLGGDLYEAAERIGFRAADYRALKALPEDDQEAVRLALESGDRDEAMGTLTDLVSRQRAAAEQAAAARAEAEQARDEAKADYEALSEVHAEQTARLRRLESGATPPPPWDERILPLVSTSAHYGAAAKAAIGQIDLVRQSALTDFDPPEEGVERDQWQRAMRSLAEQIGGDLYALRDGLEAAIHIHQSTLEALTVEE
ncbi:MAG: hypothetical protein KDI42_11245 [Gammaproteobacteria bacterium]|nr:hypothetical protein [Gammaproteobacteria bacterium]